MHAEGRETLAAKSGVMPCFAMLRARPHHAFARKSPPPELLSLADLQGVLQPLEKATPFPPRVYLDPKILARERTQIFEKQWVCVGRSLDAPRPGDWFRFDPEQVIVVRGIDGHLRAFYNVCPHRGASLVAQSTGHCPRLRCPYHGWIFSLAGELRNAPFTSEIENFDPLAHGLVSLPLQTWKGFVFIFFGAVAPDLTASLSDLASHLSHQNLSDLVPRHNSSRDLQANWKLVMENFAESHHFPLVHPELERLTSSRKATSLPSQGQWQGGTMALADWAETVALDGKRSGRPLLPGTTVQDARLVRDFLIFPNLLLSLQPDYLLVYRVFPITVDRTRVDFEILFPNCVDAVPATVLDLWTLINTQDQQICEQQQVGIGSRGYGGGCYTDVEDGMHRFDVMVAKSLISQ